jgi:hypothetical protein
MNEKMRGFPNEKRKENLIVHFSSHSIKNGRQDHR